MKYLVGLGIVLITAAIITLIDERVYSFMLTIVCNKYVLATLLGLSGWGLVSWWVFNQNRIIIETHGTPLEVQQRVARTAQANGLKVMNDYSK